MSDGFRIGQIVRRTSGAGYYAVLANRADATTRVRNCTTGREAVINTAELAGTQYPDDTVIASMFTATDY